MRFRFIIVVFAVSILMITGRNMASADENNNQSDVPMTLEDTELSQPQAQSETDQEAIEQPSFGRISLKQYEAAAKEDLLLCEGDEECLKEANQIQPWSCAADACNAASSIKDPLDCFEKLPVADRKALALSMCDLLRSPDPARRKEFLQVTSSDPYITEDYIVEYTAYVQALKVSGDACAEYIKDYMGPYGPNWGYKWYKALAGCRILSNEISSGTQKYNFHYWYNLKYCSIISDPELRKACEAIP